MMIYEKKYGLRVSDFDKNDQIKPFAVADLMQSVADEHAGILKVGYNDLLAKDLAWVLLRNRLDFLSPIEFGTKEIIVKTWPHVKGRVDYDRDYLFESVDGKPLIKASSKWCVINFKTRRIALGGGVEYPEGEYFPQINYEGGLKKIADFDILDCEKFVGFAGDSSLDHNGHVNNAKYLEFILDAISLEKGEKIKAIEINYINELTVGSYEIFYKKEGDNRLIKGLSQGKESFRAIFEIEKE